VRLRIGRVGSAILSVACLGLFVCFGALFHLQYSRWRGCFNEQGRCFDAEAGVVYQAQSGIVWGALAVVALGGAGVFLWRFARAGR
jgi:hypothetical protein